MITDEQINQMVTDSLQGRQNAHKRVLRQDARAALAGDAACREELDRRFTRMIKRATALVQRKLTITLTPKLADAIERYLDTDWKDGRDPSKFGALNAVAYIGEQIAGIYIRANKRDS